jgi:hypothetical protein
VIRTHDTLEFSDLEFALRVRPIGEVASIEVFPAAFGLVAEDVSLDDLGKGAFSKISKLHKKIYHKTVPKSLRKHFDKFGKVLKKGFIKFAPILGIAAIALNFIVPGLGILVGLAINLAAGAMKMQAAKKEMKDAKKAESADEAAEQQKVDAEADQASIDAYSKGESYFVSKYGMTRDKFMALTSKGRYDFLMGVTYDANVGKFTSAGVTRDAFVAMPIDNQTALLAQINAAGGVMTEEDAIDAMFGGSSTLPIVAIGVGAVAIILVVYLLTRE